MIPENVRFDKFEVTHTFEKIGEKVMLLNARKVVQRAPDKEQVLLLAIEDITEYRQVQKIIAEREGWFRNMANNAPIMIWETGLDKLCRFVNKAFLDFRGLSIEDVLGKNWTLDAHPDDVGRCLTLYYTAFEEKKPFELTYRLKNADGTYRHILTKANPNITTEGSFTGFIGSCIELQELAAATT